MRAVVPSRIALVARVVRVDEQPTSAEQLLDVSPSSCAAALEAPRSPVERPARLRRRLADGQAPVGVGDDHVGEGATGVDGDLD